MKLDKLGYEEFRQYVLENISKVITNKSHIEENEDFYELIIFKMFERYQDDELEPITLNNCVKLFDIFLYSMFQNGISSLPEDLI